jgi:hypothetical protein
VEANLLKIFSQKSFVWNIALSAIKQCLQQPTNSSAYATFDYNSTLSVIETFYEALSSHLDSSKLVKIMTMLSTHSGYQVFFSIPTAVKIFYWASSPNMGSLSLTRLLIACFKDSHNPFLHCQILLWKCVMTQLSNCFV